MSGSIDLTGGENKVTDDYTTTSSDPTIHESSFPPIPPVLSAHRIYLHGTSTTRTTHSDSSEFTGRNGPNPHIPIPTPLNFHSTSHMHHAATSTPDHHGATGSSTGRTSNGQPHSHLYSPMREQSVKQEVMAEMANAGDDDFDFRATLTVRRELINPEKVKIKSDLIPALKDASGGRFLEWCKRVKNVLTGLHLLPMLTVSNAALLQMHKEAIAAFKGPNCSHSQIAAMAMQIMVMNQDALYASLVTALNDGPGAVIANHVTHLAETDCKADFKTPAVLWNALQKAFGAKHFTALIAALKDIFTFRLQNGQSPMLVSDHFDKIDQTIATVGGLPGEDRDGNAVVLGKLPETLRVLGLLEALPPTMGMIKVSLQSIPNLSWEKAMEKVMLQYRNATSERERNGGTGRSSRTSGDVYALTGDSNEGKYCKYHPKLRSHNTKDCVTGPSTTTRPSGTNFTGSANQRRSEGHANSAIAGSDECDCQEGTADSTECFSDTENSEDDDTHTTSSQDLDFGTYAFSMVNSDSPTLEKCETGIINAAIGGTSNAVTSTHAFRNKPQVNYFDSACSDHTSGYKVGMTDIEPCAPITLTCANNQSITVRETGDVQLTPNVKLTNVRIGPAGTANLVSATRVVDGGRGESAC
jgi:hypothetical protein